MKWFNRFIYVIIFLSTVLFVNGQVVLQPKQVENQSKGIIYKKERSFGIIVHENGMAIELNRGKLPTFFRTNYYTFQLGFTTDPREQKQNKNYALSLFSSSRSFVYGKVNSLINLRAGIGYKKYLSQKARRKGVAIGYNVEVGPSLAILKPYYLDLIYTFINEDDVLAFNIESEKYTEESAEKFLTQEDIYGSSGFFKGFSELSFLPGIQAKGALHFSLGAYDKYVKAMEVGLMGDLFIKKIPILVESEFISNKPYFLKLYLKFEFGVRRNN